MAAVINSSDHCDHACTVRNKMNCTLHVTEIKRPIDVALDHISQLFHPRMKLSIYPDWMQFLECILVKRIRFSLFFSVTKKKKKKSFAMEMQKEIRPR